MDNDEQKEVPAAITAEPSVSSAPSVTEEPVLPSEPWVAVDPIKEKIQHRIVDKHLVRDAYDTSKASFFWRKIGNSCEGLAKTLVISQSVISFAAATFDKPILGFVSGGMSAVAIGLYGFASYSMSESKERTEQLNLVIGYKGIPPVPNIAMDSSSNPK